MTCLLDTHIILWIALEPEKLSRKTFDLIGNQENSLVISTASVWEIVLKVSIGRLRIPMNLEAFIRTTLSRLNARVINITLDDTLGIGSLPLHHKDPFDRILISQSRTREIPIITKDAQIGRYDVEIIW
jgi:PIN domain nuclease of toxin-antitoxin system